MEIHSPKFQMIKDFYDGGYWNITRVRNAVIKNWITSLEYTEITGEDYI